MPNRMRADSNMTAIHAQDPNTFYRKLDLRLIVPHLMDCLRHLMAKSLTFLSG